MDAMGHRGVEVLYLDNARQWGPFFARNVKFVANPIPEDPVTANLPPYTQPQPTEVCADFLS